MKLLFESESNRIKRTDKEHREFADLLKKNGHMCVRVYESLPCQIGWCEKEKCVLRK